MKKFFIVLIIVITVISFSVAVYFGFRNKRGVPVAVEEEEKSTLNVPYIDRDIDLIEGLDLSFWDARSSQEIELLYQVMILPWPKPWKNENPFSVKAKAFHNIDNIYFYIEWEDDTEDRYIDINKFSDAGAVMFPLNEETRPSSLMMGFLVKANIWHWKASRDSEYWLNETAMRETYTDFHYPFEEEELFVVSRTRSDSAVSDLVAANVGTVTPKPLQNVEGRGVYENGVWKVVFRRALEAPDPEVDAGFDLKERVAAFAVWNGSKGDRGGRKSITDWVDLVIE
jgi:hypothetical protein